VRAGASARARSARVPSATSWLLMALTALAAFVGSGSKTGFETGLATGSPSATGGGATAAGTIVLGESAGPSPRRERASQLPAPSVVGAFSTAQSGTGPGPALPPPRAQLTEGAGSAGQGAARQPTYRVRLLDDASGRAPPVTTGT
jgi:hypothetical protein